MSTTTTRRTLADQRGQSLVEFAIVMPLFLIIVLGIVEVGFALVDQHVTTRLTREGSNLISRDTPLAEAAAAVRSMASRPLNFDNGSSKLIFSVLKRGETTGTTNYNQIFVYQRYEYGSYPGTSKLDDPRDRIVRRPQLRGGQLGQQLEPAAHRRPDQSDWRARRADLRHGNLHAPPADHAARSTRHHGAADLVLDRLLLDMGGPSTGATE